MKIESFSADSDLIGRRVLLRWAFVTEVGETIADMPSVSIRRKQRDFEFPPSTFGDPYLLYDSAAFPPVPVPGVLAVKDLPDADAVEGSSRIREQTCTVAEIRDGSPVEVVRRTVRTVFAADRAVLRREVELLDVGGIGGALEPGVPYYYRLDSPPAAKGPVQLHTTATPGDTHRHHRALYEMVPQIYRRHDTVTRPIDAGVGWLPEAAVTGGQLRRFLDVFGAALDSVRSSADGLRSLRKVDEVDPRFLPLLAQWIGWDLTADDDIARQRNEIRTAPGMYAAVGTLPGLRSVVDFYTGWTTRVAEFAQHITRSNVLPQLNVFASVLRDTTWVGTEDASGALGFAEPNAVAIGSVGGPASLTGTVSEPYAVHPGMTLTIAVDGQSALTISFGDDIGTGSAGAIAAVIDKSFGDVHADVVAGKIRLRTRLTGPQTRIEIVPVTDPSLVSLDGAPTGRLATAVDSLSRCWLAFATTVGAGGALPRLLIKAMHDGRWYDAYPVSERPVAAAADPVLIALPDDRLWLGWIEDPMSANSRLCYRFGTPDSFTPARLRGDAVGPFRLVAGTRLAVTGHGSTEVFQITAGDYLNLGSATAAEVSGAMNLQFTGIVATLAGDGSIVLTSRATGPGVALRIDLAASNAAHSLGFGDRSLTGKGDWSGAVQWSAAVDVPVTLGRHADCTAALDPGGAVRLVWSTHVRDSWRIIHTRWGGSIVLSTPTGVQIHAADGSWTSITTLDGLPSDDVRDAVTDANGSVWIGTAGGAASRSPSGVVTVLTAAPTGLVSNRVRAVAVDRAGSIWFGTEAGASALAPDGGWTTVTVADGLANLDIRHVLAAPDGSVWFATAGGVFNRASGGWRSFTRLNGFPSDDVRHCAVAGDGAIWVATAAGIARIGDTVTAHDLAALGPGANDVRSVAVSGVESGGCWLATAAGVVRFRSDRDRQLFTLFDGLPSVDCRSVVVDPAGPVWVGTAAGVAIHDGPGWQAVPGGPATAGRITGPWAAPQWLPDAGPGERDPHLLRDGNRLWLASARRAGYDDPLDGWQITLRTNDFPAAAFSAPAAITTPAGSDGRTDRQPVLTPLPAGAARIFFRSNRSAGSRLWTAALTPAGVPDTPVSVTTGPAGDHAPAVLAPPGRAPWLLFRSDRNLALGRLGGGVPGAIDNPSRVTPGEASVRRFAGSLTATVPDLDRNRLQRHFGDLLDYTPQRPDGSAPKPDELYTPGTIGLYVERGPGGRPLVGRDADRLRQLLQRFLPVNVRAVVVLRSDEIDEIVFDATHPLRDAYSDDFPFAELMPGATEKVSVGLPGWLIFLASNGASRTVDLTVPSTLRTRSWWPPAQ